MVTRGHVWSKMWSAHGQKRGRLELKCLNLDKHVLYDGEENSKFWKISILQKSTQIRYFSWSKTDVNCDLGHSRVWVTVFGVQLTPDATNPTANYRTFYRTFGQVYRSIHSRIQFQSSFILTYPKFRPNFL